MNHEVEINSIYDGNPVYDYRDSEENNDKQISKRRGSSFGEIMRRGFRRLLRKPFTHVQPITRRQDFLGTIGGTLGDAVGDVLSFAGANPVS